MSPLALKLKNQTDEIRLKQNNPKKFAWPEGLKQEIVSLISSKELTYKQIIDATGIAPSTLYFWSYQKPKHKPSFKEISITKNTEEASSQITLSWGAGLNITGLSFDELTILLEKGLL